MVCTERRVTYLLLILLAAGLQRCASLVPPSNLLPHDAARHGGRARQGAGPRARGRLAVHDGRRDRPRRERRGAPPRRSPVASSLTHPSRAARHHGCRGQSSARPRQHPRAAAEEGRRASFVPSTGRAHWQRNTATCPRFIAPVSRSCPCALICIGSCSWTMTRLSSLATWCA